MLRSCGPGRQVFSTVIAQRETPTRPTDNLPRLGRAYHAVPPGLVVFRWPLLRLDSAPLLNPLGVAIHH